MKGDVRLITRSLAPVVGAAVIALAGLAALVLPACAGAPKPASANSPVVAETQAKKTEGPASASSPVVAGVQAKKPEGPAPASSPVVPGTQATKPEGSLPEVVVYVSDLPKSALYEFDFWNDPASPGGRMVGTPNTGEELDPPLENDPHVTFKVQVQRGVPYRAWIHMKVGAPKGVSQANLVWVQFSDAVDKANKEILKPGTRSYLTAQGPESQGWAWVGCDPADRASEPLVYFRTTGEVTVRVQAGMEGVGFDQFLLSPSRFLERPPSEAVVKN